MTPVITMLLFGIGFFLPTLGFAFNQSWVMLIAMGFILAGVVMVMLDPPFETVMLDKEKESE